MNILTLILEVFFSFCLLWIFSILNHIISRINLITMRLCQKHWHNLVNTITIDYLNVYKFQHRSFYMFLRMCTYIHSKHFCKFRRIHFYNFHYKQYNILYYNRTYIPWPFLRLLQVRDYLLI